jgi:3-methylcrotonyl-CoA carboxylase alpha subunit
VITPHYDPMIAKLITWGVDRDQARARMAQALSQVRIAGVSTNAAFLYRLMQSPAFATADLDTGLIERERSTILPSPAPMTLRDWAIAAAAWLASESTEGARRMPRAGLVRGATAVEATETEWTDPWRAADSWRVHGQGARWLRLATDAEQCELRIEPARSGAGFTAFSGDEVVCIADPRLDTAQGALSVLVGAEAVRCGALIDGASVLVSERGRALRVSVLPPGGNPDDAAADAGSLAAPMPGKVVALMVAVGAVVERGQPLAVLEAMKMEHVITAPEAGRVTAILHSTGSQVQEGAALLAIEPIATGAA